MAGKSKSGSGAGTAIGVVVALFGGYVLLKWLGGSRANSTVPGGFVGGGYGGASTYPYSTASAAQNPNSLLNALAAMLGKGKSSAPSGGSGGGLTLARPSSGSLAQQIQGIANYTTIANTMPLAELNGASLANYVPDYNVNDQIPLDTSGGQLYDVNQNATDIPGAGSYYYSAGGGGMGDQSGLDTTSYSGGGLDSLSLQDVNNFDVSSY